MARIHALLLAAPVLFASCANPDRQTLARLRHVEPDLTEVAVEDGLDRAMSAYQSFLTEAPESSLTPEAMRRLADLKIEKDFGVLGGGSAMASPERATLGAKSPNPESPPATPPARIADHSEPDEDFERRAASGDAVVSAHGTEEVALPGGDDVEWSGPEEAIALYDRIMAAYPEYEHNDQVLYQKARAYDELGRNEEAIAVIDQLVAEHPDSRFISEVQFRRAEYFFVRRKYLNAEESYLAVTAMGSVSPFYELALYKLGWTFYKQEMHEEALQQYVELLDHKVATGYDFDQTLDESDAGRVADTYRVISLSFSSLGGPEVVNAWFATHGQRGYEDRIYSHLGEFYLEKLRYHDAARSYTTFVGLNPLHPSAPHFNMRVVEVYEAGGFPKLVLESKKRFAATYGLQSEYWRHFDIQESPEVLSYLRSNLEDLANHHHALYQDEQLLDDRSENFAEAHRWYRAYLASFPAESGTPAIHYRLADLLLENEDFGASAHEYEQTAYAYEPHEKASAAGYAAIYAHREHLKVVGEVEHGRVVGDTVASSLRFVDTYPEHEQAAAVLGAAVDDLYALKEYQRAIDTGRRLIDEFPEAEESIRRAAWAVVAHASFDLADYVQAEDAYQRVLGMTSEADESRSGLVDNLAATIYKQAEEANEAGEFRVAADHFLRITAEAPTSKIRPAAEYDAAAALIRLEDWSGAASVLDDFRETHPDHELSREATRQIAYVQREQGNVTRAAEEYERVAEEAETQEARREAMLVAGDLYEESGANDRAIAVYARYVDEYPRPLETAVETRFKLAELHEKQGSQKAHYAELRRIVAIDRDAGDARTERVRFLAGQSALVLTELLYHRFEAIELTQPFAKSLKEKRRRMDAAIQGFDGLVDYEVGEVTAAATYYIAEIYSDFSRSLMQSERPTGLGSTDLQDYELMLEEEAFPFEERAIDVHEKNLELMAMGVFNRWIQQSLDQLALLMPGRYAKFEESSGLIASLDTYAYRAPHEIEAFTPAQAAPEPDGPPMESDGSGDPAAPTDEQFPQDDQSVPAAPAAG